MAKFGTGWKPLSGRWRGKRWGSRAEGSYDRSVIAGAAISFLLVAIGALASGQGTQFLDLPSVLIVAGGTFGATLVHFSFADIAHAWSSFLEKLAARFTEPSERIASLVRVSQAVKSGGILTLEQEARIARDPFLKMALEFAVDTQDPQELRRMLEIEMRAAHDRADRSVRVFETMGTYAPAMGLIGTLIGLIQMLGALDNPSTVGPAMAVALVTTLYGAIMANLICLPIAGKLRLRSEEEMLVKAITIEGVVSLARQESAIILEQKLQSFTLSQPSRAAGM